VSQHYLEIVGDVAGARRKPNEAEARENHGDQGIYAKKWGGRKWKLHILKINKEIYGSNLEI
jgi:hypothetical protein